MDVQRFEDVWANVGSLVGARVRVCGEFFSNGTAFVAADFASCMAGRRMRLLDDGAIEAHLLKVLPAWGGGPFIYNERITVTGTVQRRGGEFELAALTGCTVTRSDPETSVDVPVP
jgi:hypothetical protein